ncbi:triose-phosphate isomerase [Candidatus Manganitrophus noduliformans]|uniref:Triosephosphate isomerase n=1 Tax=Candidatus Manganitrophus noduliformans TaxID=2606439 RepID=A0A7X6I9L0_9BACT|nr:triose-phosphate isomerase [Candidatus Manganitrophus noduliformans]NKE69429.1 triose-phosphate isomerase [Candidatus Manganitrophus noduliformans]
MRTPCFIANWKMNKTIAEAREYLQAVEKRWPQLPGAPWETIVAPPFTMLAPMADFLKERPLQIGLAGQNVHFEERGAYTGEVSPLMLRDAGCRHVIIGHSERRTYFGETNALIHKKIGGALRAGLIPILCVGETREEREEEKTGEVIERQIREALDDLRPGPSDWIIAYEPVWAIGTGLTPQPSEAEEVHRRIRDFFRSLSKEEEADTPRILYGGSATEKNIAAFMEEADIDGVLAGGASLFAESFCNMIDLGVKAKEK